MKVILATGIYPPEIGGPATYVHHLAEVLLGLGAEVTVITYASKNAAPPASPWSVLPISRSGGPLLRWIRYSRTLRKEGKDADIVYAFSLVSVGIPVALARLKKPKRILRLGGDFLWERYTDWQGKRGLKQWYAARPLATFFIQWMLRIFDHIVFSTWFQEQLYERVYKRLPRHTVIENALPEGQLRMHARHDPFRLLFLGRFVRFKNLRSLLHALASLPHVTLTLLGEGPIGSELSLLARRLHLKGRLMFLPPVAGEEKEKAFQDHDLLILPSLTEISPHVALEARASGLPVLLTEETGLSEELRDGMVLAQLRTTEEIVRAILDIEQRYEEIARRAALHFRRRTWEEVGREQLALFHGLV